MGVILFPFQDETEENESKNGDEQSCSESF